MSRKIDLSAFRDYTLEAVPEWAISYLVNDDPSGLTGEDVKLCDEWAERMSAAGYDARKVLKHVLEA